MRLQTLALRGGGSGRAGALGVRRWGSGSGPCEPCGYNCLMFRGIALFLFCFVVVLILLIFLQPSSQESALSALTAAEKVLEQVKVTEAPAKLDEARKILSDVRLPLKSQAEKDKAIAAIDEAKIALGSDQAQLTAATAEIKAQITQAKANLTALTAAERARGVKEQLLALVWPVSIAILILYIFNPIFPF